MTTKRIVYTRPDGGVSVVVPAPGHIAKLMFEDGMTEDEALDSVRVKDVPKGAKNVRICDCAELPSDRTYRDTWTNNDTAVAVDMAKARAMQAEKIVAASRVKARELNERETIGEDVAAEKAALKAIDMKASIEAATTPEELKSLWPRALA